MITWLKSLPRRKFIFIYIIAVTVLSLLLVGVGSWLIIPKISADTEHVEKTDTNEGFISSSTFSGEVQEPTPKEEVFGADYVRNDGGTTGYTLTWTGCKLIGSEDKITRADYAGLVAGTHYYEIKDNTTGQIISKNHAFEIAQDTFTIESITTPAGFEGDTVTVQITVKGTNADFGSRIFSDTHTIEAGEYGKQKNLALTVETTFKISGDAANSAILDSTLEAINAKNYNTYNSNNFAPITVEDVTYVILPMAYSYDGSTTTYHGTLNSALSDTASATSATTLVAMQSFAYNNTTYYASTYNATKDYTHTISGGKTVGTNVTLLIPYKTTTAFTGSEEAIVQTDRYATSSGTATGEETNMDDSFVPNPICVNMVSLSGTLTNNGKIEVAGITGTPYPSSSKGLAGATSGKHATIKMEQSSSMVMSNASSALHVNGYISNEGNAKITAQSGQIIMPFVVYDYGGGTVTVGLFKGSGNALTLLDSDSTNVAPFMTYDMPNIQAELVCHGGSSGATITAHASLFTNGVDITIYKVNPKYNLAEFDIFGDTNALFNMSSGTATFKYNYEQNSSYAYSGDGYVPNRTTVTDIALNGDTNSGDITMSVNAIIKDVDVSLSSVKFPVSDKIHLHLGGGKTYNFTTEYKFLPGSELYIEDGSTVNVAANAGLMFYDKITVTSAGASLYKNYYNKSKASTPAKCYVTDGTLNVAGSIAGTITANGTNATLNLSSATALTMTETEGDGSRDGLNFTFTAKETITQVTKGFAAISSSLGETKDFSKSTYEAVQLSSGAYAWAYDKTITVSYNSNGGSSVADKSYGPVKSNVDLTLTSDYLPTPTRAYYTFAGWYLDSSLQNSATNAVIYQNTTLYAKWTPIEYSVNFEYVYNGFTPTTIPTVPGEVKFTVETGSVTLPTPTSDDYNFIGWYTDSACANESKITSISGAELLGLNNNNTLYGLWASTQYTITFNGDKYGDLAETVVSYTPDQLASATLPTIPDYSTNTGKQFYFDYWSYNGEKVTDVSFINASDTTNTSYELTAVWIQKYELKISNNSSGATSGTDITIPETTYLLDSEIASKFSEYDTQAKAQNSSTATNKYFVKWEDASGKMVTSISVDSFDDSNKSLTLNAVWGDKYSLTYTSNNTSVYTDLVTYGTTWHLPNTTITLPNVTSYDKTWADKQYYFNGYDGTTGTTLTSASTSFELTANTSVKVNWGTKYKVTITTSNATVTVTYNSGSYTSTGYVKPGESISATADANTGYNLTVFSVAGKDYGSDGSSKTVTVDSNITVKATADAGCFPEGTLITLADGTQKPVEDLVVGDELLVFNHFTGRLESSPLIFSVHADEERQIKEVLRLIFSDGTELGIIKSHGLFDYTEMQYVYIDKENVDSYIGHEFYLSDASGNSQLVKLESSYLNIEETKVYAPMTAVHMNCFANGLLTTTNLPYDITGHVNYFDYLDDGSMKYDEAAMQNDIEMYGTYTYEDFDEYISYEAYRALPLEYLKVAVGKGMLTFEEIIMAIEYLLADSLI